MLEILALYFLCRAMGRKLREKGWETTVWMQIGVVLTWFGGMFVGAFSYGVYLFVAEGEAAAADPGFAVYPVAIAFGAATVGLFFLIAHLLPAKTPTPPPLDDRERLLRQEFR